MEVRDRIPVGARFSAPVRTGPGAHPASSTIGTGSFPGVKGPRRGVNPTPSSAEVNERVELYLFSPLLAFVAYSRVIYLHGLNRDNEVKYHEGQNTAIT